MHQLASFMAALKDMKNDKGFDRILTKFLKKLKIRGGADKFLALPRKKRARVMKLHIYSTYSPLRLMHLLQRSCSFSSPSK